MSDYQGAGVIRVFLDASGNCVLDIDASGGCVLSINAAEIVDEMIVVRRAALALTIDRIRADALSLGRTLASDQCINEPFADHGKARAKWKQGSCYGPQRSSNKRHVK